MELLLSLIALAISAALAVNEISRRSRKTSKSIEFYFKSNNVEAMYYDEEKESLRFPHYGSPQSAGFDLKANQNVVLDPGQFMIIPTGIHMNLPEGHELQIRPRSGLAAKYGITVLNTPGTVDEDYTGEIKVILINNGANRYTVKYGERIAQGVLAEVTERPDWNQVSSREHLKISERGAKGFGSTGK